MKNYAQKKSYKKKASKRPPQQPGRFSLNRSLLPGRSEIKEANTQITGAPSVSGYVFCLNGQISTGTDDNNRIGRVIKSVGIQMRGYLAGPTANSAADYVRIALVWDQQPNTSLPVFGDIFDVGTLGPLLAFKNTKTWSDRYTILFDRIITVQNQIAATSSAGDPGVVVNQYISLRNYPQTSYASTGNATPSTGALYYVAYSFNNTASTTTSANQQFGFKYTYTDS